MHEEPIWADGTKNKKRSWKNRDSRATLPKWLVVTAVITAITAAAISIIVFFESNEEDPAVCLELDKDHENIMSTIIENVSSNPRAKGASENLLKEITIAEINKATSALRQRAESYCPSLIEKWEED